MIIPYMISEIYCETPSRMNWIAIAAKSMAITFDTTIDPTFPRSLWMGSMNFKTIQVMMQTIATEIAVAENPTLSKFMIVAVIAPGPTNSGTPRGTAPDSSGEIFA